MGRENVVDQDHVPLLPGDADLELAVRLAVGQYDNAGQVCLAGTRLLIEELDDADDDMTNSSLRVSGPVRISVASTFGRLHVLPLIPELLALYPELEVDLVLSLPAGLVPVEIKLTSTPTLKHAEVLGKFKALAGRRAAGPGLLVCNIPEPVELPGSNLALPWREFPTWLREQLEVARP